MKLEPSLKDVLYIYVALVCVAFGFPQTATYIVGLTVFFRLHRELPPLLLIPLVINDALRRWLEKSRAEVQQRAFDALPENGKLAVIKSGAMIVDTGTLKNSRPFEAGVKVALFDPPCFDPVHETVRDGEGGDHVIAYDCPHDLVAQGLRDQVEVLKRDIADLRHEDELKGKKIETLRGELDVAHYRTEQAEGIKGALTMLEKTYGLTAAQIRAMLARLLREAESCGHDFNCGRCVQLTCLDKPVSWFVCSGACQQSPSWNCSSCAYQQTATGRMIQQCTARQGCTPPQFVTDFINAVITDARIRS